MAEQYDTAPGPLANRIDGEQLAEWLRTRRWFASKSQTFSEVEIIEEAALDAELSLTLSQVRLASGATEVYQLLLTTRDGEVALEALSNPDRAHTLLDAIDTGRELKGEHGSFNFRHVGDGAPGGVWGVGDAANEPVRPIGAEQSNTSIVFGERLVLKLFRRLESGINPELEMLRFLSARSYPNIAPLYGWYEYEGEALAATLGIVQQYIPDGTDGWQLALAELATDPEKLLEQLGTLGTATARLHSVLATDPGDPAFSPEEPSIEAMSLLLATLDEEAERVFHEIPDEPGMESVAELGQQVRERISELPKLTSGGRMIRLHGDYHLGQALLTPDGWMLLDFEGEPARSLTARRAKRSPLRDVASMLRSFSYASWAVELQQGQTAPDGFEDRAREVFLDAYLAEIEPVLLPGGDSQIRDLLAIFELEKALYELRYELNNRPDWVPIPVAGLTRIVESA